MNKQKSENKKKLSDKIKKTASRLTKPAKKLTGCIIAAMCLAGCATVDQPNKQPNDQRNVQAGKSETQNVEMHNSNVYIFVGVTKVPNIFTNALNNIEFGESVAMEGHTISVLSQAQALESSGTETYSPENTPSNSPSNTPTATPTNDVRPETRLTYGLCSDSLSGTSWIAQLTDASIRGIASIIRNKNAKCRTIVTKKDGTQECVVCEDGTCTNSKGDRVTCGSCSECSDCTDGSCGSCSPGGSCSPCSK